MNKALAAVSYLFLFTSIASAQIFSSPAEMYSSYFNEVKAAEDQSWDLWDRDMYGPILLVNPSTREVYSNYPDLGGALTSDGDVYHGMLPAEINTANTMVHWNGRDWAMVMLPLPRYKKDRVDLMAHELFHVAQSSLGFRGYSPANSHLDDKNGRILMRLELEALRKALESTSSYDIKEHITDAMIFREYRYTLFPEAKTTENLLELNEGLAEYTGFMVSNRTREEAIYHFETDINSFVRFPTFVRSFAYETIPIYGYLLQQSDKFWNKKITPGTNLTDFFIREFWLTLPADIPSAERSIENQYDGKVIRAEETNRETIREAQVEKYRKSFIYQPHLEIHFENMRLSFDPTDVIPLDDKGNVYPVIRVTDNWGILDVHSGALMSQKWDKITTSAPAKIDGRNISGDGWTLLLNDLYTIVEDSAGNYQIIKR
ncbi:MAG TPA: hypothetical protein VLX91_01670 [Candidatus Acidoferrales bacterium]|nr:hypothetical protein [Candidatus Acidoferrales bacterium]